MRLAVAEEFRAASGGPSHRWRAGGMLLQFVPRAPERARVRIRIRAMRPKGTTPHSRPEDDAWIEGRSLIETVEDVELIDPALSSERLLYRLFHERGVRVFRSIELRAQCSCSRESVEAMLRSFPQCDRDDMIENGVISVTCEFCSTNYVFEPTEVARPAVRTQSIHRALESGLSSENVGIAISNASPLAETMPYVPVMKPDGVGSGTPLVYSNDSPGLSTGCLPTTPAPRTSCRRPIASVMRQCRVRN